MLKSKLMEIKEREKLDKIDDIKGVKTNIEWALRYVPMFSCHTHWQRTRAPDMRTAIFRL